MRTISSRKWVIASFAVIYGILCRQTEAGAQTETSVITKSVNDYSYYALNVLGVAAPHAHDYDTACNTEANNFVS
jgi:hypothetical protein